MEQRKGAIIHSSSRHYSPRKNIKAVLANISPAEVSTTEERKIFPFEKMEVLSHQEDTIFMMEKLFEEELNADVIFLIDEVVEVRAHRAILGLHSPVLKEMLLGYNFRESQSQNLSAPIPLPGKRSGPFRLFLRYLYTGRLEVPQLDLDSFLDVLFIANEYQVTRLSTALCKCLTGVITMNSVFRIFDTALALDDHALMDSCRDFLCENAQLALKNPSFYDLSARAVSDIISRDAFDVPEIDILMAISLWYDRNKSVDIREILGQVRFERVNLDGLTMLQVAPLYELLVAQNIDLRKVGVLGGCSTPRRGVSAESENVATPQHGATVLNDGDPVNPMSMINGQFYTGSGQNTNIDAHNSTYHSGIGSFITVRLAKPYRVDSMLIVLKSNNTLGFTVDTSLDNSKWERLVDCTPANQQYSGSILLIFPIRRVQFIKLTGQADYDWFFILHFECPTTLAAEDRERYKICCPNGGTLLYQRDTRRQIGFQP